MSTTRRLLCLLLALLCGCADSTTTYSGTLHTEAVEVGSTVGGRVSAVLVAAGDRVHAGQTLVRLDDRALSAALEGASARLDEARAQLADLLAGARPAEIVRAREQSAQAFAAYRAVADAQSAQIQAAQAQVRDARAALAEAKAVLVYAEATYKRQVSLNRSGDMSRASVDAARSERDRARAGVQGARARLTQANARRAEVERAQAPNDTAAAAANARAARASVQLTREGSRPQQIALARAHVASAAAALAAARVTLDEMTIRAPLDGTVEAIDLHPGDLLQAQATAALIDSLRDPYVRIYVPQSRLSNFTHGHIVTVRSDALPGQTFQGVDEEHDRSAQFTPRDVQTAEDRANLTFGVKIRVHDPEHRLYGGTSITVSVP